MTPGWLGVLALTAAAFVVAIALTPAVQRLAQRLGFVDHPGERKVHREPMPTGGGFAVAGAFFAVLWISTLFPGAPPTRAVVGLTVVGVLALLLGYFDDRFRLPAWFKLIVQAGCGVLLHEFGFGVDKLSNPFAGDRAAMPGNDPLATTGALRLC